MTDLRVREDVELAALCTLGVGGRARAYVEARSIEETRAALRLARDRGLPLLVLGGGSNLVIGDLGFDGLVLHVALRGRELTRGEDGTVDLVAGAGEEWDPLVAFAVENGLAGIECLSGIPGRVGATPIQNVGAYGQEVRETIVALSALDVHTGELVTFTNEECRFGYRDSRFKREDRGRYVVTSVTFRLREGGAPAIRYADLEKKLAASGVENPTLADARRAVLEVRRSKSMVIDPDDENRRSVGSFFMNPVVSEEEWRGLEPRLRAAVPPDTRVPAWPGPAGVKLSAAWLIENAGLHKGLRRNGVGISTRHTLALVNCGGAKAADVAALAAEIRARVRDRFGVTLQPEPVFVNVELPEPPASS
jgi:UDP-N-acetylmuramate dehydrogenase